MPNQLPPRSQQPPTRSGDPQRDWYEEDEIDASVNRDTSWDPRQLRRMSWRAEGAQDLPGGALETLLDIAERRRRGPRHQPSDARLREILCEQLTEHPHIDATDLAVDVEHAEVTLHGTVSDLAQKRAAERLAAAMPGVVEVHNRITVRAWADDIERRTSGL